MGGANFRGGLFSGGAYFRVVLLRSEMVGLIFMGGLFSGGLFSGTEKKFHGISHGISKNSKNPMTKILKFTKNFRKISENLRKISFKGGFKYLNFKKTFLVAPNGLKMIKIDIWGKKKSKIFEKFLSFFPGIIIFYRGEKNFCSKWS